jgi:hypothetical protein
MIEQGAAVVRIENDTMQRIALQRPRDEARVLEGAIKELDIVPALSERIYYSIPYKNHVQGCSDRRNCNCPQDYVRGVSIRGAENLVRRWGNASVTCRVVDETEEAVHLEGVFLDLETNVRMASPRKVSKFKTWKGRRQALYDDQLSQAVAAESSKAMRNAILNGLPDWLVESYYQRARSIAVEAIKEPRGGQDNLTPGERVVMAFAEFGVTSEQVEDVIGKPIAEFTDDDLANLRGLYSAVRDGEKRVEEVFPEAKEDTPSSDTKSVDDVLKGGGQTTGGTEAEEKEEPAGEELDFLDQPTKIGRKYAKLTWREVMKEDPSWVHFNAKTLDNPAQKARAIMCSELLKQQKES